MKTIHIHRGASVEARLLCRPGLRVLKLRIKSRLGISHQEFVLKSHQRATRLPSITRGSRGHV